MRPGLCRRLHGIVTIFGSGLEPYHDREAIGRYGAPEVFNTDQGAQFTSEALTRALKVRGVRMSLGGKGHWLDNVYVECF